MVTSAGNVPSISSTLPSAVQGNITSTGTITSGTWAGSAVAADKGGAGQTSYTVGDILYADSSSTLSRLPAGSSGQILTANGAGAAPSWQTGGSGSYQISCIYFSGIAMCVRVNAITGASSCMASYNSGASWVGCTGPFSAAGNSLYSVSCMTVASAPFCVRLDMSSGSTTCATSTNSGSSWVACGSPF